MLDLRTTSSLKPRNNKRGKAFHPDPGLGRDQRVSEGEPQGGPQGEPQGEPQGGLQGSEEDSK